MFSIRRAVALGLLLPTCTALVSQPAAGQANGTAEHVRIVSAHRTGPGRNLLLVTLRVDPGYHINANPASSEFLIPTTVVFSGAEPQRIAYPPAVRFKPDFTDDPIDVYEGTVIIAATYPPGPLDRAPVLEITVTAQACTTEICLAPADLAISVR